MRSAGAVRVGAVVFDAVGTLLHPDPPAAAYAAVGRRHGSRLCVEEIGTRFAAAFRRQEDADRAAGWRTDEAREAARWRAVVAETLYDAADPAACFAELHAHFARPNAWRCDPDAAATLAALAARGLRVGLASNFDGRLHGVVAGLPELRPVQGLVVASAAVGWRKPAAEFFRAVQARVGLPPEEILFIGDDPATDYDGARAAGLRAVLYDPRGRGPAAAGRVRRLADLTDRVR
jgi:putative hydrolase of the HAD superfamily